MSLVRMILKSGFIVIQVSPTLLKSVICRYYVIFVK